MLSERHNRAADEYVIVGRVTLGLRDAEYDTESVIYKLRLGRCEGKCE